MKSIYSKVKPGLLLHIITDRLDFKTQRVDITEPENFLQVALIRVNEGQRFRPHIHIDKEVTFKMTKAQECWVVINGLIVAELYDIDDNLIDSQIISEGGVILTLHGGHTFQSLEDNTFVYEMKSGPYEGQTKDKVFINETY